jgi:hypothetical protein
MLRTLFAVGSMGVAIAIFSCSGGTLGGGHDGGPGGCQGITVPAACYRACNGSYLPPNGGSCPDGYVYSPSYCSYAGGDGSGPISNTCGDDGGGDGATDASPDACLGTMVWESCYRTCDGAQTVPDGGTCPAGFWYSPSVCIRGSRDGSGPVTNTCGADGAAGAGGAGGSGGGNGGAGGGGSGVGCTDLANDAAAITARAHTGDRPADSVGVGGVIADGVYDLVGLDNYRTIAEDQWTASGAIRISNGGTRMESVLRDEYAGGFSDSFKSTSTVSVAGAQIARTGLCPDAGSSGSAEYTATPTTLMISNPLTVSRYLHR